ncbi:hypothetical protein crov238 [Cafeteria roenbergensis virus]|uniref:Chromosomal protein MC1 domain-containing protein n=1 Tax=Cafeteria roenbergensis virus (strain BV-PW1) TaxID=693272 RepID=E3T508_CROVB|nr:hypothetical protein crov238 [Cafeteria roenbergensis virus BV-PW1]ADO67271.1 hypothetical protein crov238 [Cafeteria roenbergensis virus BV-PW1]
MSPKFTKKPAKKNHKSQSKKALVQKDTPAQETAPVETPLEQPVQETAPVKKTTSKKVAKKPTKKEATEVAPEEVQETAPVKKTTSKKAAKKEAAPKKVVSKKADSKTQKGGDEKVVEKEKTIRSFKVQLPGNEDYTGRFTGWTPYQAANKALSRYFRSNDEPQPVVTFSIRESTRGSHHKVYTYEGLRVKLDKPVKYTIGGEDGTPIVKHYKNQLKKIKKAELSTNEEL